MSNTPKGFDEWLEQAGKNPTKLDLSGNPYHWLQSAYRAGMLKAAEIVEDEDEEAITFEIIAEGIRKAAVEVE